MTHDFSSVLTQQRKSAGLHQSQVADALFMSRSTYNHYEKGTRIPPIDAIIRISAFYRLNPLDLICTLIPKDIELKYPDYIDWVYSGKYAIKTKQIRMITLFSALTEADQKSIEQMMLSMYSSYKS